MAANPSHKIYSANEVARYFIYLATQKVVGDNNEKEGITNLKLQKILYFAQAYYVSKVGRPVFSDKIEAWAYGPVIPTVYHQYKTSGSNPIFEDNNDIAIDDEDKKILSDVWEAFGGYSASRLVDISHGHEPWKTAFKSSSKIISESALAEYYGPLLNK